MLRAREERLSRLPSSSSDEAGVAFYELRDEAGPTSGFRRFIFSTPESRSVCNCPEIVGFEFTNTLKLALTKALKAFPERAKVAAFDENSILVFNILRGGLNFKLRDALYHAFGFNRTKSSFVSSHRLLSGGEWKIVENGYKKIKIPDGSNIFMGDIVATGASLKNALEEICGFLEETGRGLRNFFLFTIGTENAERILSQFDRRFRELSPSYENTYLFYIEGRFGLARADSPLRIKVEDTDLLRHPALLAPEFELSQYEALAHPLERCVVYDGGSRSFDIEEYFEDVASYWRELLRLAEGGATLLDLLCERWPEREYGSFEEFAAEKARAWEGVGEPFLRKLFSRKRERWGEDFLRWARKPEALALLCHERLAKLK
jgi:uracil phosphoribosyltransferase